MIQIIVGTDRPGSRTAIVARLVQADYQELGMASEIMDLGVLATHGLVGGNYFKGAQGEIRESVQKMNAAEGIVFIVPEYNGSFPGILKLFIDYWKFPDTFESRPMCFIGLGGRFGGLRAVEHLQQIFSYRNAFLFNERVFLINVPKVLSEDGKILDPTIVDLLKSQATHFSKFIQALESEGLDANSRLAAKG
jgi:NAD(P)H-dependent FMN reductase